ncbi:MAG: bifunctional 4-hydroxy-2-oxoglutarate aldolase/2-dehydro-3-deoxy-phosphogluconate aldolase [Armatimonadota bacterium]|nr:bifunctional 4-hydroxy-2-oxoglutarate aldolase/2-dehydro-3-deoxy-phosphogluconate aldolase [Armatimonadota bacterium]
MPAILTAVELEETGLIAIIRTDFEADLMRVSQALAEGGIRAMEITLNTPGALAAITAIRHALSPGMRVGAGTILSPDDARSAFEAGAEFIVTPTLQTDTIAFCREHHLPIACGCMTPTEALTAHRAGADFIKLFPSDTLGPGYVRALLGPLPFLKIIPTGGVSRDNLAAFLQAGSVAVAIGGNLVSKATLRDQDWAGLTDAAREYMQTLAAARGGLSTPP